MYSKATLSLAVLAVAKFALAQSPACLLAAVNSFDHPADQETLCCKLQDDVEKALKTNCGDAFNAGKSAYEKICKDSGYDDCKKDESSSSASASKTSSKQSGSTSAPYPIVSTTTYYDTECSCTKTSTHAAPSATGSTGFFTASNPIATGTNVPVPSGGSGSGAGSGSGSGATGSPIAPAAPGETGAGSGSPSSGDSFQGAATKNVGSVAAGLLAVAAIALAL